MARGSSRTRAGRRAASRGPGSTWTRWPITRKGWTARYTARRPARVRDEPRAIAELQLRLAIADQLWLHRWIDGLDDGPRIPDLFSRLILIDAHKDVRRVWRQDPIDHRVERRGEAPCYLPRLDVDLPAGAVVQVRDLKRLPARAGDAAGRLQVDELEEVSFSRLEAHIRRPRPAPNRPGPRRRPGRPAVPRAGAARCPGQN